MKRFSLIFLGALAMLMASCSKHNPQQPDPDAWVTDLSLPVPIQFGSTGVVTKAGFETIDDLNGLQIGIFGLATHEGADWSLNGADVLCAHGTFKGIYNTISTIQGTAIEMTGGPYYYPRLSEKNYSFYGFYPRTTGVDFKDGNLCVPVGGSGIKLGFDDIIWAKAEAKGDGYNAQYIRDIRSGKVEDKEPEFNFRHVTAGLKIAAVAKTENGETNQEFENINIKSVKVDGIHRNGSFCIAGPGESQILNLSDTVYHEVKFNLENYPSPTLEGTTLLEIFPYPDPETDGKYKVKVQVEAPNGNYPVEFTTETLVPGSRYVYNISFSKINGVSITVGGIDWDNTHNFDVNTDDKLKPEF